MNINNKGSIMAGLLTTIGLVLTTAILPASQSFSADYSKANDSERKIEINSILSAVYQYQTSPTVKGALLQCQFGAVPVATDIPECDTDGSGMGVGNGGFEGAVQLGAPSDNNTYDCTSLLVPNYLRFMPIDPNPAYDASQTGYYICQDTSGVVSYISVIAVGAEVYTNDGGCEVPGTTNAAMCVSG